MFLLQVACESATKTGMVMIFGEITTKAKVDYEKVRWRTDTACRAAAGGAYPPGILPAEAAKPMSLLPGWYKAVCCLHVHCYNLKRS